MADTRDGGQADDGESMRGRRRLSHIKQMVQQCLFSVDGVRVKHVDHKDNRHLQLVVGPMLIWHRHQLAAVQNAHDTVHGFVGRKPFERDVPVARMPEQMPIKLPSNLLNRALVVALIESTDSNHIKHIREPLLEIQ
ncbi:UNVERIFIED_CONTAM: hypothetical protein ACS92_03195 [Bacillus cereus]